MREATYEKLKACYLVLVYAAETYGAGGAYTDPAYDNVPQIIPPTETAQPDSQDPSDTSQYIEEDVKG